MATEYTPLNGSADPVATTTSEHPVLSSADLDDSEEGHMDLFTTEDVAPEEAARLTLKQKIYNTFDNPRFSLAAKILNSYIMILIVISCVGFCLQSVVSLSSTPEQQKAWLAFEIFIVVNFSLEYLIRLATSPSPLYFIISPLNIIDLLAILPFYITLFAGNSGLSGLAVVRVLRLVRFFRLFKIGKTVAVINLLGTAAYRSRQGILVLLFLIVLAMVFFASFIFYAETSICELQDGMWVYTSGRMAGEVTGFQNIPASFWWAVVTLTTVGYGDMYPVSGAGKFVAAVTMVTGILVLAFPITLIGVYLTDTYNEFHQEMDKMKRERALAAAVQTPAFKSQEELLALITSHQDRADELASTIATAVQALTEQMQDLAKEQQTLKVLFGQVKRPTSSPH